MSGSLPWNYVKSYGCLVVWNMFFSHILGITTPTDFHIFQRGRLKPPSFPSFRAMCMLGPWSEALGAISTNWVQLWDYTCIPGHLAAAGSDARAPASLEHGRESSFASQLSTVVSACDAQGTEALCTKAVIIGVSGRHWAIPTTMAASFHMALSSWRNHLSCWRNEKPAVVRWGLCWMSTHWF